MSCLPGYEVQARVEIPGCLSQPVLAFAPQHGGWATWIASNGKIADAHYFCHSCRDKEQRAWENFTARARELFNSRGPV